MSKELDILKRALQREKRARISSEETLELKSYELYLANHELKEINENLENVVEQRSKELKQNEARFRRIVESASDIIYRGNEEGRFTYANPTTVKLLEYPLEDLLSMRYSELVRPDHVEEIKAFYINQFEKRISETYTTFPVITKSGSEVWLGQSMIFSFDEKGQFTGFSAIARDITVQQEILDTITQSEKKYRGIISNMNLGLLEVDLNDRIVTVNNSFCEMVGYTTDELVGKVASDLFLMGENKEVMSEKNKSRTRGNSDVYEIKVRNKAGNLRWWLISGAPVHDDQGNYTGSIGIHLDITQQKVLEEQLKLAKEEAESSSHAKETFLANMSHEIRTPMNGILGIARQLEKTELNKEQDFYLKTIVNAADSLRVILNDILDISKVEAGKLEIETTQFDLTEVVDRVRNILLPKAEEKDISFSTSIDPRINSSLIGDPTRINQILLNLAGNSVKFTQEGGVSISCDLTDENDKEQRIEFKIRDSGIGISEDYQQIIFEKFSQEDKSVARKFGGTGLGMSISKQLVELMGGELDLYSEQGKGTQIRFTLILPKPVAGEAIIAKNKSEIDIPGLKKALKNKKVLLAEDNEINQMVVTASLDFIEVDYETVLNGEEAVSSLKDQKFDLVLMDINMPKMDGMVATKKIREELGLDLPIVALTANAMKGARKKYLDSGMNDSLTKPFIEEELYSILQNWLTDGASNDKEPNIKKSNEPVNYSLEKLELISRGNKEFINKMLSVFVSRTPEALDDLRSAIAVKDLETIYKVSHKIKPTIHDLNILSATDQIISIEARAIKGEMSAELEEDIQEFCAKVDWVIDDIASKIKS